MNLLSDKTWLVIGFFGQALFFMRFFVQWIASEKEKKSIIPHAFWYLSLAGGLTLFMYAVKRSDPVFIMGQSTGLFIYVRNIYFIRKEKKGLKVSLRKEA
ncbi:MAG: lipid-A-disaccharide synthase N-terminal domain-containing protein [Desulforegulaceae bacterium]|nr:lipid-A-disaccharide synthase N-terminal domain-containing protein [Desulforegulaceae bacterium]